MDGDLAVAGPVPVPVPVAAPLAGGELRDELERALLDIAHALRREVDPGTLPPDVAGGNAGLALLFAALHRRRPREGWGVQSRAHWDAAARRIAETPSTPMFFGGFPGVAWTALRIRDVALPARAPGFLDEIDDVLVTMLRREVWPGSDDLVSGLTGCGVYLLERLPDPRAVAGLERIVQHLEGRAVRRDDGITWRTPPELLPEWQRRAAPHGYFNLGLAHGVPGVIALLARMAAVGVGEPAVAALLEGAVRWVLAQEIEGARGLRYPAWIPAAATAEPARPARVAWCYGDLGIAAALVLAARSAGRNDWMRAGLRLAHRVASLPFGDTGVLDTGICHGSAGVAHVFHRLARISGDPVLADASRAWLRRTLSMRRREGIAGFPANRPAPGGGRIWAAAPGVLEGAAGVALVLLAAISERSSDWDRFLLLSGPSRGAA